MFCLLLEFPLSLEKLFPYFCYIFGIWKINILVSFFLKTCYVFTLRLWIEVCSPCIFTFKQTNSYKYLLLPPRCTFSGHRCLDCIYTHIVYGREVKFFIKGSTYIMTENRFEMKKIIIWKYHSNHQAFSQKTLVTFQNILLRNLTLCLSIYNLLTLSIC